MEENLFTIEQFRRYVESQDSLGDVLYYLNEENITKANQSQEEPEDEDWSDNDSHSEDDYDTNADGL